MESEVGSSRLRLGMRLEANNWEDPGMEYSHHQRSLFLFAGNLMHGIPYSAVWPGLDWSQVSSIVAEPREADACRHVLYRKCLESWHGVVSMR